MIDDRVAFVGGIDLTLDGGDPYDTSNHRARGGIGWHDARGADRRPAVRDVADHFRLRWQAASRRERCQPAPEPGLPVTSSSRSSAPLPAGTYRAVPNGDYSILESYVGALRSAERSSISRTSSCGHRRSSTSSPTSWRDPPTEEFRVVVLLPARANDGADISRGQVAALIDADDGNDRFLACTVYAREGSSVTSSTCTRRSGSSTTAG